jgi:hypothetical protein
MTGPKPALGASITPSCCCKSKSFEGVVQGLDALEAAGFKLGCIGWPPRDADSSSPDGTTGAEWDNIDVERCQSAA